MKSKMWPEFVVVVNCSVAVAEDRQQGQLCAVFVPFSPIFHGLFALASAVLQQCAVLRAEHAWRSIRQCIE